MTTQEARIQFEEDINALLDTYRKLVPGVKFYIKIDSTDYYTKNGEDKIEFRF